MNKDILLDLVVPSPTNPRQDFDEAHIRELADGIKSVGLLQKAQVRPFGEKYQLIFGECRWRAHLLLRDEGCTEIGGKPWDGTIACDVEEVDPDLIPERQFIENKHRMGMTGYEEAVSVRNMMDTGRYRKGVDAANAIGDRIAGLEPVPPLETREFLVDREYARILEARTFEASTFDGNFGNLALAISLLYAREEIGDGEYWDLGTKLGLVLTPEEEHEGQFIGMILAAAQANPLALLPFAIASLNHIDPEWVAEGLGIDLVAVAAEAEASVPGSDGVQGAGAEPEQSGMNSAVPGSVEADGKEPSEKAVGSDSDASVVPSEEANPELGPEGQATSTIFALRPTQVFTTSGGQGPYIVLGVVGKSGKMHTLGLCRRKPSGVLSTPGFHEGFWTDKHGIHWGKDLVNVEGLDEGEDLKALLASIAAGATDFQAKPRKSRKVAKAETANHANGANAETLTPVRKLTGPLPETGEAGNSAGTTKPPKPKSKAVAK